KRQPKGKLYWVINTNLSSKSKRRTLGKFRSTKTLDVRLVRYRSLESKKKSGHFLLLLTEDNASGARLKQPSTLQSFPKHSLPVLRILSYSSYESYKAVPWNYHTNDQAKESAQTVSNLAGLRGMTRSGRC
ncbi:hypothetical protein ACH5RR_023537, partial [Cinchona calisaya]